MNRIPRDRSALERDIAHHREAIVDCAPATGLAWAFGVGLTEGSPEDSFMHGAGRLLQLGASLGTLAIIYHDIRAEQLHSQMSNHQK